MRRIKQHSKPQRNAPSQSNQIESTSLNKPTRAQKGPPVVAPSLKSGHAVEQTASQPQRASLRKQQFGREEATVGSGEEMTENTEVDAVNSNFSLGDGGMSYDEQETGIESDSKTNHNRKSSQKQIQDEPHSMLRNNSSLRRSSRLSSRAQYSTDSNSSFASPDPPKRQRGKQSTDCKQLTKPHKIEPSVPPDSTIYKEQNEQGSRRPKKVSLRNSDDVLPEDSIDFPTDDDEERRQHDKKGTLLMKRTRQRKGKSELKINGHLVSSEDIHSEYSEDEESVQRAVSNNRRSKKSETGKANTKSKKPQTEKGNTNEQDELLDGKWTEEELQKLHE